MYIPPLEDVQLDLRHDPVTLFILAVIIDYQRIIYVDDRLSSGDPSEPVRLRVRFVRHLNSGPTADYNNSCSHSHILNKSISFLTALVSNNY